MITIDPVIPVVINMFRLPDFLAGEHVELTDGNYYKHDNRYVRAFGPGHIGG